MPTTLTDLAINIHSANKQKGWYDDSQPRHPAIFHMLIVSEIAEAVESVRKGELDFWTDTNGKPQGEAVEVIDALIRILDYCGYRKWDVDELIRAKLAYNKTRPQRHGNKAF